LADKSTQLVLEALGRAAAEPDGVPLLGTKPALFRYEGNYSYLVMPLT